MTTKGAALSQKCWSAAELRKLPAKQRNAILKIAAAMAEEDYRIDSELTAFDAFGKGDLYGESSDTETRRNRAH
jgi:hypothetical protein